jgi:hypothetical protein
LTFYRFVYKFRSVTLIQCPLVFIVPEYWSLSDAPSMNLSHVVNHLLRYLLIACLAAPARSDALPSPQPTTLAATRFTIDNFGLVFSPASDAPVVSVGADDSFSDGLGSLVSTSVLIRTPSAPPDSISFQYRATRVDVLLYKRPQSSIIDPGGLSISLFADVQGAGINSPGIQVG